MIEQKIQNHISNLKTSLNILLPKDTDRKIRKTLIIDIYGSLINSKLLSLYKTVESMGSGASLENCALNLLLQ